MLGHKKEWNNTICNNMDGHWGYHTRWSKPDRGHISLICGIKKNDTNELIYKIETDSGIEIKLRATKGEREEG